MHILYTTLADELRYTLDRGDYMIPTEPVPVTKAEFIDCAVELYRHFMPLDVDPAYVYDVIVKTLVVSDSVSDDTSDDDRAHMFCGAPRYQASESVDLTAETIAVLPD